MKPMELVALAVQAREKSYCPYSGFAVGAALECADGTVYTGCNIENAAFGPSVCAERTAVFKAVSEGRREFAALAVVGGKAGLPIDHECPPCGVCRQVLREFCDDEFAVHLSDGRAVRTLRLGELLPESFRAEGQLTE
jgi:cytidine deaminase